MIHARKHPSLNVDGCYPCKLSSIRFGGLTRLAAEREGNFTQASLEKETVAAAEASGTEISRVNNRWI